MRTFIFLLLVFMTTAFISGCATKQTPDATDIASLPIVELGQDAPKNHEYVLLLRSGRDIPVTITIAGSLLSNESKLKTTVQLKRDIYLYNKWSSLDGKNWTEKNINFLVGTGFDTKGGLLNITVDEISK